MRSTWPLNFSALNATSSKAVIATDLKFDKHVYIDSPELTPKSFFQKGRGQGHVIP